MEHKRIQTIGDLTPDPRNANRGTERGVGMLERSLRQYGADRSILVDKHGVVIAGNKTLEQAAALGLDVEVVRTDGTKLVAVQRTDLDLATDQDAKELGVVDNRSGQVGLDWDPPNLETVLGGMDDPYRDQGTYAKSFYPVLYCPSSVGVSVMRSSQKRIHHRIDWNATVPKIVHERHRKAVA